MMSSYRKWAATGDRRPAGSDIYVSQTLLALPVARRRADCGVQCLRDARWRDGAARYPVVGTLVTAAEGGSARTAAGRRVQDCAAVLCGSIGRRPLVIVLSVCWPAGAACRWLVVSVQRVVCRAAHSATVARHSRDGDAL